MCRCVETPPRMRCGSEFRAQPTPADCRAFAGSFLLAVVLDIASFRLLATFRSTCFAEFVVTGYHLGLAATIFDPEKWLEGGKFQEEQHPRPIMKAAGDRRMRDFVCHFGVKAHDPLSLTHTLIHTFTQGGQKTTGGSEALGGGEAGGTGGGRSPHESRGYPYRGGFAGVWQTASVGHRRPRRGQCYAVGHSRGRSGKGEVQPAGQQALFFGAVFVVV